jgi:hypothetical protein
MNRRRPNIALQPASPASSSPRLSAKTLGSFALRAKVARSLVALAVACEFGCARSERSGPPGAEVVLTPPAYRQVRVGTYVGHIASIGGEGLPLFLPCNSQERWFLGPPSNVAVVRRLREVAGPEALKLESGGAILFVHVRGRLYGPNRFGPHGEYAMELCPDEVSQARRQQPGDCARS